MIDEEAMAAIEAPPKGCVDAIDAALEFERLVATHNLSIADLANGFRLAIGEGHGMVLIALNMAILALTLEKKE